MYFPTEIIVLFFLISFFVYTMPLVLVKFSKTIKGKFLLLMLMIVVTLYNKTGGLLIAMLIIFLSEFNYEVNNGILYEGFDPSMEMDGSSSDVSESANKKNPKMDQLAIAEYLKSKSA